MGQHLAAEAFAAVGRLDIEIFEIYSRFTDEGRKIVEKKCKTDSRDAKKPCENFWRLTVHPLKWD